MNRTGGCLRRTGVPGRDGRAPRRRARCVRPIGLGRAPPGPSQRATALGAAYLAGLEVGYWMDFDALRKLSSEAARHEPRMSEEERQRRLTVWRRAVQAVIAFYAPES